MGARPAGFDSASSPGLGCDYSSASGAGKAEKGNLPEGRTIVISTTYSGGSPSSSVTYENDY